MAERSTTGTVSPRSRYVTSLDGLRAVAIVAVVAYHLNVNAARGGFLGVPIMFLLSGYLVTSLLLAEYRRTRTIDLKAFWVRRLRRIMPQAVLCVVVTAALCTVFNHVLLTKMRNDVIPALLMFINWAKIASNESYFAAAGGPSPLTHYWTLAIEAQFYLVWPPVLLLLIRRGTGRHHLAVGLAVVAAASALAMALTFSPDIDPSRSYYGTDTRAFSLIIGCLLALFWPLDRLSRTKASEWRYGGRLGLEMGALVGMAVLLVMFNQVKGYDAFPYQGGTLLCTLIAAVVMLALVPEGTLVSRVMSIRPLAWLGSRSYAIYLWHYPIIQLMTNRNSTTAAPLWWYVAVVALTLGVSELTYRLVERPLRNGGIREWLASLRPAVASLLSKRDGRQEGERGERGRDTHPEVRRDKVRLGIAALSVVVTIVAVAGLILVPPASAMGGDGEGGSQVSAASLKRPLAGGMYDAILIGDSVPLSCEPNLSDALTHGLVDCAVSRQASAALEVYDGYRDQGVVGDIVVFCVGTNGRLTTDILDQMVADVGPDKKIWFVNDRMPDAWQDDNNQLLDECAATYDNVNVIDWHGLSEGHDDWFWSDGTHPRQESDGITAYVNMITDAIGYDAFEAQPTTYDVTLLGDGVALDASDELASTFPQGVIDCAAGRSSKAIAAAYQTYASQDVVGDDVIVALGSGARLERSDVTDIVDAVGDSHTLWLVNSRTSDPWCTDNDQLLQQVADEHDNVKVIDWYSASADHDSWFAGDGEHLSDEGKAAYAETVKTALGR